MDKFYGVILNQVLILYIVWFFLYEVEGLVKLVYVVGVGIVISLVIVGLYGSGYWIDFWVDENVFYLNLGDIYRRAYMENFIQMYIQDFCVILYMWYFN